MPTAAEQYPRPNLSQWIETAVYQAGANVTFDSSGPVSRAVSDALGSEQHTSTLIANTVWQSYVQSPAFSRELKAHRVRHDLVEKHEILVAAHNNGRYSLLISDPEFTPGTALSFEVKATADELRSGWENVYSYHALGGLAMSYHRDFPLLPLLAPPQVLKEVLDKQPLTVLVAGPMEEELTHAPSPHAPVLAGAAGFSTAGVYVQDGMQRIGVTAAEHAVTPGTAITVDGLPGTVLTRDHLTDSCFIHVPGIVPRGRSSHGPLRLAPRQFDAVTFEGGASGIGSTRVIAWNYELPYIDPNLQQTVRTDLITSQGDSGAALLDSADYIIGFAHSRSSVSAVATYSSWIWADAVLQKHSLTIY